MPASSTLGKRGCLAAAVTRCLSFSPTHVSRADRPWPAKRTRTRPTTPQVRVRRPLLSTRRAPGRQSPPKDRQKERDTHTQRGKARQSQRPRHRPLLPLSSPQRAPGPAPWRPCRQWQQDARLGGVDRQGQQGLLRQRPSRECSRPLQPFNFSRSFSLPVAPASLSPSLLSCFPRCSLVSLAHVARALAGAGQHEPGRGAGPPQHGLQCHPPPRLVYVTLTFPSLLAPALLPPFSLSPPAAVARLQVGRDWDGISKRLTKSKDQVSRRASAAPNALHLPFPKRRVTACHAHGSSARACQQTCTHPVPLCSRAAAVVSACPA